ncbi:MAG: nucleoside 2-deoxyribosyltransferase [Anaerocolumna sp.]
MNKIFLAAPFKSLVDENNLIMDDKSKEQISNLIIYLENKGFHVHNAHKREQWGQQFMPPDQCTQIDFNQISDCDILIAFPGNPPSPGTHIEIGWASALDKRIFLLLHESINNYAYLIQGLHTVANITYIVYSTEEEYYKELDKYF